MDQAGPDAHELLAAIQEQSPDTPDLTVANLAETVAGLPDPEQMLTYCDALAQTTGRPLTVLAKLSNALSSRLEQVAGKKEQQAIQAIAQRIERMGRHGDIPVNTETVRQRCEEIAAIPDPVARKNLLRQLRTRTGVEKAFLDQIMKDLTGAADGGSGGQPGTGYRVGSIAFSVPDEAVFYGPYRVNRSGIWADRSTQDGARYELVVAHEIHPEAMLVNHKGDELGVLVRMPDGTRKAVEMRAVASNKPAQDLGQALGILLYPKTGQALQEFLGTVAAVMEKREAISEAGWDRHRRLVLPGQERIVLGPVAELPYGRTEGDEQVAWDAWREIVFETLTRRAPAVLLVLGHVFASPLRAPLKLNSGALHLAGDGSTGKSNATELAMALCGPPDQLVRDYDATRIGPERMAALARHLAVALDEPRTARDPKDRVRFLFKLISGRSAMRGTIHLGLQRVETWRLSILSNGESGMVTGAAETGAKRRAGEWSVSDVPLWDDPKGTGVTTKLLAAKYAGWPLVWGARAVLPAVWQDPEAIGVEVRQLADRLLRDAGASEILNEFAITLTLAYQGAGLLGQTLQHDSAQCGEWWARVRGPLYATCKDVLAAYHRALMEDGGVSVQLRLAQEMLNYYQARPHEFIRRRKGGNAYGEEQHGDELPARPPVQYSGVVWVQDDTPVEIGFYPRAVQDVARAIGLMDPAVGLRELAKNGILKADRDGKTSILVKINGVPARMYVLRMPELQEALGEQEQDQDQEDGMRF